MSVVSTRKHGYCLLASRVYPFPVFDDSDSQDKPNLKALSADRAGTDANTETSLDFASIQAFVLDMDGVTWNALADISGVQIFSVST